MSDNTKPAFPCEVYDKTAIAMERKYGLTKREWFAGQALAGILQSDGAVDCSPEEIAAAAYLYADAMLAAKEETKWTESIWRY